MPRLLAPILLAAGLIAMPLAALADQARTPLTITVSDAELAPRHAAWTALLETYVEEGADGVNRFDYAALTANPADLAALRSYIASFAELDFAALSPNEAFAAWANLYNALTVDHIVGRYPVRSIRSGYLIGPWKRVKTIAGGREVSLDAIEHDILRVQWNEPRVHYAVNCAAYGCPNLQTRAWEAASLDADLDAAARAFVNHPRGVAIRDRGGLRVSTIYRWFEEDFGDSEAGVIAHLMQYADADLRAAIEANADIRDYDYDWSLNDTAR